MLREPVVLAYARALARGEPTAGVCNEGRKFVAEFLDQFFQTTTTPSTPTTTSSTEKTVHRHSVRVATFLVDQALLRAGLSVNSARAVDLIPLAEQALRDVGVWLNCIHDKVDAPVHRPGATAAAAAAAPPLAPPAPRESPPPKQHQQHQQQQQQHNLVLGPDLAAVEGFCEDVERQLQDCREHVAWLERPPDQRMRPTHPAPLRQHRVTQLLVKLRGAREQALERFAAHCVAWPNGPQKFPLFDVEDKNITDIKAVLGCSSPAELEVSLLKYGLCTTDTTGKACLRHHYPAVWAALEKLCSDDTTSDDWDEEECEYSEEWDDDWEGDEEDWDEEGDEGGAGGAESEGRRADAGCSQDKNGGR